jgi:hypothetical protein
MRGLAHENSPATGAIASTNLFLMLPSIPSRHLIKFLEIIFKQPKSKKLKRAVSPRSPLLLKFSNPDIPETDRLAGIAMRL